MELADTLSFVLGEWTVARRIDDHRSRSQWSFRGISAFVEEPPADGDGLMRRARYDERGVLHDGVRSVAASRALRCSQLGRAPMKLYFADERPFVDLDLRAGSWRGVHRCSEDRYEIVTDVRSHGQIEERWSVRGPGKDYDALTTLRRSRPRDRR